MRESHLEKSICDYAKKTGWEVYKFSSPGHRAVPDRMFISLTGTIVFIEVKAPGQKPTPLQYRELERLSARCVPATWADSLITAKLFLDQHNNKQPTALE
jgi:Holliday junction resolvase